MKLKFSIVVAVLAVSFTIGTMSFRDGGYTPRNSSQIDDVVKHQIPGGKIAAGMSEYFNALRANPMTGTVSEAEYFAAVDASLKINSKRTVNSVWNEMGPDNVGGRTRAFLQDKDTPSLMFVGGVSGGLFRSTTKGSSWVPVNDFQENLNISCITQTNSGKIIYGTGEGEFVAITGTSTGTPGFAGLGMFISSDRGRSFSRINGTSAFGNINSLAYDKVNNIIYASTSGGIRKSTDDGATWTMARAGNSKEVKVASNGNVIAQSNTNIVRSTDQGSTWTVVGPDGLSIGRASIAISPQDPNYVYIMASVNSKLAGVFRSTDGAASELTWAEIAKTSSSYFDPLISSASSQGNYNNVITVNPLDKNHIIMGGVLLAEWKQGSIAKYIASLNEFGGANPAYVHADKHVLEWDMSTNPPTLICGNDGGLFFSSDNLRTFTNKNKGFNATQFYAVAADYEGNVTGGTQDNGTQYINKKGNTVKSAVEIKGGDGFQSDISVKNNSIIFSETYYGNITRSRDYGKTQSCIWDRRIARSFGARLTDTSKYCEFSHQADWAPFNTKFRLWEHPDFNNEESRLFIAKNGQIWMGIGVTNFQKEPDWYLIGSAHGGSQVWDIEPTPDGNSVFITNSSNIYRIDGLNSATYDRWSNPLSIPPGITMTPLGFNLSGGRAISSICLDPSDANKALITLGNYGASTYVYKGSNMLGTPSYTNITNNLPAMPVYDGLIAIGNPNLIFLATDLGVYASDDGGNTWTSQTNPSNKFPKVATLAIRQYYFPNRNSGSIYAGTHGRGFFECQQYKTNINAIQNDKNGSIMKVFPNPASENAFLSFDNKTGIENATIRVVDFTGKTVMEKVIAVVQGKNEVALELNGIKPGVYIITGTVKGGVSLGTVKLVLRH